MSQFCTEYEGLRFTFCIKPDSCVCVCVYMWGVTSVCAGSVGKVAGLLQEDTHTHTRPITLIHNYCCFKERKLFLHFHPKALCLRTQTHVHAQIYFKEGGRKRNSTIFKKKFLYNCTPVFFFQMVMKMTMGSAHSSTSAPSASYFPQNG